MRLNSLVALCSLGWTLSANCVALSAPVDLSTPSGGLGAANAKGYLEIWREVDGVGIQLGKGSYLPLRYKFSTEFEKGDILGAGFHVPMFEARNALIREGTMRAYLPCGKGVYLWRSDTDPNMFQTPDKEWMGRVDGDDFTVSRVDGWKILYRRGRLSSITSDDNHTFTWSYSAINGGIVSENDKPIVTMVSGINDQIAAFAFGGEDYRVEYGKRPIVEAVNGQTVLKELDTVLSGLEFPGGKFQGFEFNLTDERLPKLTAKDVNGSSTNYTWDAKNRHLLTEDGPQGKWTYAVGTVKREFEMPVISRTNSAGETEINAVDNEKGIYTKQAADGSKSITHVFRTPGALYNKIQKIESVEKINGKEVTTVTYHAFYDEAGRLFRETDVKGFASNYNYGKDGRVSHITINPPSDPKVLEAVRTKEQFLLETLSKLSEEDKRGDVLQQLAFLYIYELGDVSKARALVPSINSRMQVFNVKLHSILGNRLYSR